ncbi:Rossmann-fold NAD(P)-binding domain-containing protein [Streptomyces niger]|uniref:hypothetical protein n=1 Tax=Streptomyces niger TaxID=66373 RepID=UPI00069A392B|nr:hypothetical protein [Streptomyces niger]
MATGRPGDREPETAIPDRSLVLTDDARFAEELAETARARRGRLYCTDPACPSSLATVVTEVNERSFAGQGQLARHLRVISNGADSRDWPQPPPDRTRRLGELAFLAMKNHTDLLTTTATVGVLVVDGFVDASPSPYGSLVTALLKSFMWDQHQRPYISVVTDAPELFAGLDEFGREHGFRTPFWRRDIPTAYYRAGTRHFPRLVPDPMPSCSSPLADGSVIVASGGARGITAAVLRELARQVRATFYLLGSTDLSQLPTEILEDSDEQLARRKRAVISQARQKDPNSRVAEVARKFDQWERARETRATIDRLAAIAGEDSVHYIACDVTDPDAVRRAATQVLADGRP